MKKYNKIIALLLILAIIIPGFPALAKENGEVTRLAGLSRIKTAISVSQEVYRDGSAKNVVLAGWRGEVDALTGTLLASSKDAPLLLIDKYDDEIKKELRRLGAESIYLLGGESVISGTVVKQIENDGYNVKRLAGKGRHETAVEVAKEVGSKSTHIFLANDGRIGSLADALAAGTVSGRDQQPILLTNKDTVPQVTLDALKNLGTTNITIVGGTSVVSRDVETTLKTAGYKTDRVFGDNRWKTATAIANKYFTSPEKAIVANDGFSGSFADALVGGYLGAKNNAPILLTSANKSNGDTIAYLDKNTNFTYVLGGETVIDKFVFKEIQVANGIIIINDDIDLEVHFIDVGQGDSVLIKKGNNSMLIDAGDNGYGNTVVSYLKANGIKKLDYVIGTHPHSDHIGGMDDVINSFDIGKVIMPKVTHNSKTFEDVITAVKNKGLKITTPKVGDKYALENSNFTILAPNSDSYSNLNNYSVSVRLEFESNSFVFTGDAEIQAENEMINNGLNLKADVLKLGHHGSQTSTTEAFLNKVNPKYAVIQVGEGNRYGHPDSIVIDRLKAKNIKTYRNDLNGNIVAVSDGETISFSTEKNIDINTQHLYQAKIDAKKALNNYVNAENYKQNNASTLANAIKAGEGAIDKATTISAVATTLNDAKKSIDAIKTDQEIAANQVVQRKDAKYVGTTTTKVFHKLNCRHEPGPATSMYFKLRQDAINAKYVPCKVCKP